MSTREDETEFMSNPNRWPQWPRLPLVRGMESGFLFDDAPLGEDKPVVVYLGNIFRSKPRSELKTLTYGTLEEILAAGWRVD